MKVTPSLRYLSLLAVLAITGCGGSSNDDSEQQKHTKSYVQVYNAAANSSGTVAKLGEQSIGTLAFGSASSMITAEPGKHELIFTESGSGSELSKKDTELKQGEKTLYILTEKDGQHDYLSISFNRNDDQENNFRFYLANLSTQLPELDVYIGQNGKGFAGAERIDTLSFQEVTTVGKSLPVGRYAIYLTAAGGTTPLFESTDINFSYSSSYVLAIQDRQGPLANQLLVDIILNSSMIDSRKHDYAKAQFRLYNGLDRGEISIALDNQPLMTLAEKQLSAYQLVNKGDYSLSVRNAGQQLLLNSALLTVSAGESLAVLLYPNANGQAEALPLLEKDAPQLKSHDVRVANLVADFEKLQFYFIRQHESIATARYHVKNLDFKKQQAITLPKDYYSLVLVHVAENGSSILLDKTDSMMLEPGQHYIVLAEQDSDSPSGYSLKLLN